MVSVAVLAAAGTIGAGSSGAALPSDPAGVPFATFAHAQAAGDYGLACGQIARVTLLHAITPRTAGIAAARQACVSALRDVTEELDDGRRSSLASTRVVRVRVKPGRARVTVQRTLYGVRPRATGSAVMQDGQWKIAKLPSGEHVGSSLLERVPSSSMAPTVRVGDTVLVDRAAYRHTRPRVGDIVVFHPPVGALTTGADACAKRPPKGQACATADRRDSEANFIKRIVGRPGDRISIRDGHVIRNGERAGEGFITPCGTGDGCDFPRTFTVAAGRYYVMGDNRGESDDSRFWGPVAARSIVGRVRRLGP